MDNVKVPVEVDPTEDTEWNDILRAHGIIPEKPADPTEQVEEAIAEALAEHHERRLEKLGLDELAELEDIEDEDFLNEYKQKRFNELRALSQRGRFGSVVHISKAEYSDEVTQALAEHFVLVHMALQLVLQLRLLGSLWVRLAARYPEIKFAEIVASRCVERYPDSNCPTVVVYHKGEVLRQYVTLAQLGGNGCKMEDVEQVLVGVGALDALDERLEREDEEQRARRQGQDSDSD